MSALDASQDREGHEIDSGGRSESDDEFDQDSVAIGNLAAAAGSPRGIAYWRSVLAPVIADD